jgi:pimeloyl-ACP methyl ester carboxylesterase
MRMRERDGARCKGWHDGETMTTFVLVHGAWHGGWCYGRIAERLRSAGHAVFVPTLTGCGERAHLLSGTVNLTTHIEDVLSVFRYEGVERAVLAGHSYGGMVITGVADRIAERISALVYLDAFVPEEGNSLFDLNLPENTRRFIEAAGSVGGIAIPPPPAAFFNINAADAPLYEKLTGPHPIAAMIERLPLSGAYRSVGRRIYVHATELPRESPFKPFYEKAKASPDWETHALACGHSMMLDEPERTAEILLSAA